jgi:cytochrome b561/polyisoprenoid-binding protein YceI
LTRHAIVVDEDSANLQNRMRLMTVSTNRYSSGAIVLHWLIAAMMVFQTILGWATEGPVSPQKFAIFQLHKSIGITILLLTIIRISWRMTHRPPPLSPTLKRWERSLAHFVHIGFYCLLLALPLTGWLIVSTSKIKVPTMLFGIVPWPHIPVADGMRSMMNQVGESHGLLTNVALALIALHIAGALKHHYIDRDAELAKMIPGVKAGSRFDLRLLFIAIAAVLVAAVANAYPWQSVTPSAPAQVSTSTAAVTAQPVPPQPPFKMMPEPLIETTPEPETAAIAEPVQAEAIKAPLSNRWAINRSQSSLGFATTWSGTKVSGQFGRWNADIIFDPEQLSSSSVAATIDVASVSASDGQVGSALPGSDWFDAAAHPKATFVAKTITKSGPNRYTANGTLTLRGVSKPLALPFTLTIKDDQATMSGSAQIDRLAHGVGQGEWAATGDVPSAVAVAIRIKATRK